MALLLLGLSPGAPAGDAADEFAPLSDLLGRAVASRGLRGASLLVAKDGQIVYEHSLGDMTPDRPVAIASGTKWLTAALVMTEVDAGRIALDDPVSKYLPAFDGDMASITIRQLLAHTSGLPDYAPCLDAWRSTLVECARQVAQGPMTGPPGSKFLYGGVGFQVAGAIVETTSGQPWATLFEERLKGPLGMANTSYGSTANPVLGGAVVSTARDYLRFLQMMLDDGRFEGQQILSREAVAEMERDQTGGAPIALSLHADGRRYGLGVWRDLTDAQGNPIQLSSQGDTGFSPWIDRRRGLAVVFVSQDGLGQVYGLVEEIQEQLRRIVDGSSAAISTSEWLEPEHVDGLEAPESASARVCSPPVGPAPWPTYSIVPPWYDKERNGAPPPE